MYPQRQTKYTQWRDPLLHLFSFCTLFSLFLQSFLSLFSLFSLRVSSVSHTASNSFRRMARGQVFLLKFGSLSLPFSLSLSLTQSLSTARLSQMRKETDASLLHLICRKLGEKVDSNSHSHTWAGSWLLWHMAYAESCETHPSLFSFLSHNGHGSLSRVDLCCKIDRAIDSTFTCQYKYHCHLLAKWMKDTRTANSVT